MTIGVVALLSAGLVQPAAARRSVTVQMTVHLNSDWTNTVDFTDNSDPSCVLTKRGTSHVVADMPNDGRPRTRSRACQRAGASPSASASARHSARILGVDVHVEMTRSQDAGGVTDCQRVQPFPSDGCGSYSWIIRGEPHFVIEHGHPRLYLVPWETVDTLGKLMADDKWRALKCGDVSDADSYISQTYNEKGVIQKGYFVPFSLSRIFAATPRRLTLHARTSFTECCPNLEFGGSTEVRTATVTIRKR